MAKPSKARGRNARSAGRAGSGRAEPPKAKAGDRGTDRVDATRPAQTAKDAAARATSRATARAKVSKTGNGKGDAAKGADGRGSDGKASTSAAARRRPAPTKRTTEPPPTGRYTPPIPKSEKVSPLWVPILMFSCLGIGMAMIILNYVNLLPGPDPSNAYLMAGLALITIGFITATKYH